VVTAPLDELTTGADRTLRQGLTLSLLILTAGVLAALLFSRWITGALQSLTSGVQRLNELDFEAPLEVRSHVREISTLRSAMTAASDAIQTFGLYVPKQLVRDIVASGQYKGRFGRRQELTALFSDIYNFTTICEQYPPEGIVAMLSGYFDIFSRCVTEHNGTIVQFIGDSVFAIWNAPIEDERHAEHACRCALALNREIDAFNRRQVKSGLPVLRKRLGIHSGLAVVGSVGATGRLQYTGMGDTLNVASRLEGLNKAYGTTILVSGSVVTQCPPDLRFAALGEAKAKGRRRGVELFELTGCAASPRQHLQSKLLFGAVEEKGPG
jgi:adenylate cyclase